MRLWDIVMVRSILLSFQTRALCVRSGIQSKLFQLAFIALDSGFEGFALAPE